MARVGLSSEQGPLDPLEEAACEGIRQKDGSSFVPVTEGVLDIETRTG